MLNSLKNICTYFHKQLWIILLFSLNPGLVKFKTNKKVTRLFVFIKMAKYANND